MDFSISFLSTVVVNLLIKVWSAHEFCNSAWSGNLTMSKLPMKFLIIPKNFFFRNFVHFGAIPLLQNTNIEVVLYLHSGVGEPGNEAMSASPW